MPSRLSTSLIVPVTPVRKVDADSGKNLRKLGVNVVAADLQDKASLQAAYQGAHTVVYVPVNNMERVQATENAIAAAQAAKIKRHTHFQGLLLKPMNQVPNSLHGQWSSRFSQPPPVQLHSHGGGHTSSGRFWNPVASGEDGILR